MKSKFYILFFVMFLFLPTLKVNALFPYEITSRVECPVFELAEAKKDGSLVKVECYQTYEEVKNVMNNTVNDDLVIVENGVIIDAKYAVIDYDIDYPKEDTKYKYISLYKNSSGYTEVGYIKGGTPDEAIMLDYDYNTKRVKIKVAGVTGWIDKKYRNFNINSYDVVPLSWVVTPQNYTVTENNLIHNFPANVYGKGSISYTLDRKPSMLNVGTYYSYDGNYFYTDMKLLITDYKNNNYNQSVNKDNPYYNYYQYLSFRTKSNYNADNINQYISLRTTDKESKMLNTGSYFINAQNNYGINAVLMMAIGMNESGRGTSTIAKTKNNLFGLGAVDSAPGELSNSFLSVEDCINNYAYGWLSYGFIDPRDFRFYGANLGNKYQGVNYKYASDPFWSEKAASYYYDIDSMFSFQDYNTYKLAVLNNDYSNTVYPKKTVDGVNVASNYQYKYKGSSVAVLEEVDGPVINGNNKWYKIQSDATLNENLDCIGSSKDNPRVIYNWDKNFVYVHSSYFIYINAVNQLPEQNPNPDNSGEVVPSPSPTPEDTPTPPIVLDPTPIPTPVPTPTPKPISEIVKEANYKLENDSISGIKPNTSVESIKNKIIEKGGIVTITDKVGNKKDNGNIGTGDKINITSGNTLNLTVLIYGDTNGDGKISAVDYVNIKNHIMGSGSLVDVYNKVADVNSDGKISAVDYVNIKNYIMGVDNVIKN